MSNTSNSLGSAGLATATSTSSLHSSGMLASASQSKLSGLKAPSKIVRPTMPKPSGSMASLSTAATNLNSATDATEQTSGGEDFKVNDKCWVNGTKPGVIAFIGETQFKEGIWAGIILETADGKNNGTLNGVTYFVTEENRGVFCRLNKLTKENTETANTSLDQSNDSQQTINNPGDALRLGTRVVVNSSGGGSKLGILRYLGTTDFAKGEWAGVELDEKLGKNDGSVAGKRYFQCEAMRGVFAPAGKVEPYQAADSKKANVAEVATSLVAKSRLQTLQTSTAAAKTASSTKLNSPLTSSRLCNVNKQISGSQESLVSEKSSIFSTASGVKPIQPPKTVQPLKAAGLLKSTVS